MNKLIVACFILCITTFSLSSFAENTQTKEILNQADRNMSNPNESPARRIERDYNKYYKTQNKLSENFYRKYKKHKKLTEKFHRKYKKHSKKYKKLSENFYKKYKKHKKLTEKFYEKYKNYSEKYAKKSKFRTINGSENNLLIEHMNQAHTPLLRVTEYDYSDGQSAMAGVNRPNPRSISNNAMSQTELILNKKNASDFLWQWGQFVDHDFGLTEGTHPAELQPISIPTGDPQFDPESTGTKLMGFNRSIYDSTSSPREQVNEITGWIDASNVYGSDEERANALRRLDGSGKLKNSKRRLLPFNTEGLSNAGGESDRLFLAGDVRANEQIGLTAMHTLFVREHNRLAKNLKRRKLHLTGDEIYQRARRTVAAQMQVITYEEFIPVLLGENALSKYKGYNPHVDASIANEFAHAAFRLGHSLLSPSILRINKYGKETRHGHISLREAFFAPHLLTKQNNIGPILRGLASQTCQNLDMFIIDDVRNFLFGQPGDGGFDLASLNIQRGRDHGLQSYNQTRISLGLEPAITFSDISSNPDVKARLQEAYNNVDDIDLWVGGLAEDHVNDALVGEVFFTILKDQFERLRDGDRFWYENQFKYKKIKRLKKITLAKIIRRNTNIRGKLQKNVFITKSKHW